MKEIKLPDNLSGKFRLTKPMYGGPVFDFPAQRMYGVDMENISEKQCSMLIARGWRGMEAVAAKSADSTPAKVPPKTDA